MKTLKDIKESNEVKLVSKRLLKLSKPSVELENYLNKVGDFSEFTNNQLTEAMGFFIAWQNYYAQQLVVAETMKVVAEQQRDHYLSMAFSEATGKQVSTKKESAKSDTHYQQSLKIYLSAKAIYNAINTVCESCDRAFRLVSRIITTRLGTNSSSKME